MWQSISKKRHDGTLSPMLDACWQLRTKIDAIVAADASHLLAVTSVSAAEGRSTVAVNLACAYAQSNRKVLLIDANLRRPVLHKLFGLSNRSGLTNLLMNQELKGEMIIRATGIDNLSVVTSGPIAVNPIAFLASREMRTVIDEWKREYDRIIIDTPPALEMADAQIIASLSDGVLLVVRSGKTKQESVRKWKTNLDQVHARIIGVVLNHVHPKDRKG